MKRFEVYAILLFLLCSNSLQQVTANNTESIYKTVAKKDYVTGNFNPARHPLFISLKKAGIRTNNRPHFLRKEVIGPLKKMLAHFHRDHPSIKIFVRSSTRNFQVQKSIWNAKWNGTRLVEGKKLNKAIKNPLKRAHKILEFSSMPGTSRHHWGTDFDINSLENSYFKKGKGKIIYQWMTKHAHQYGFCQVYTAGRSRGYQEERWHWSYMPLAREFLKTWMTLFGDNPAKILKKNNFAGGKEAIILAPIYVKEINRNCK